MIESSRVQLSTSLHLFKSASVEGYVFLPNSRILDRLLLLKSSVICLQEFWVDNEELAGMYESRLHDAGYLTCKFARTNSRGLLTAVHQIQFCLLNYRELLFNDIADHVAQVLHVEICCDFKQNNTTDIVNEAIIVNTHLLFPHDSRYCFLRLQQVYKILQYIRSHALHIPVILCGDWNGSKKRRVDKFLRSQGFVSTYDTVRHHEDDTDESQKWVSHRNHRGNICGVDFVWLQNPQKLQKPLRESFLEAILGNIKLGISGHPDGGLNDEDIRDIWERIDENGDGIVDVSSVLRAWTPCALQHDNNGSSEEEV